MRRTAQTIAAQESQSASVRTPKGTPNKRAPHPNSLKNLVATWKPGQSGNPGGRVKHDIAAEIARAVFENNPEAIYKAMSAALLKGNAYVFKEIAERGYGRLKEKVEHSASDELMQRLLDGRKKASQR